MKEMRQLLDSTENKTSSSKTPKLNERDEMDQDQSVHGISRPENYVYQIVAAAKNMRSISVQTEAEQRAPKGLWSKSRSEVEPVRGDGEREEGLVQDQLILAPEIMRIILENLDLRALKKVRLVCKSWLLEAQAHVERRGIVWLHGSTANATKVLDFMETRYTKLPGLPQPYISVNVELMFSVPKDEEDRSTTTQSDATLRQLSKLCHPLLITRLSTEGLPSEFAYPLISRCASSLEYLKLFADDCQDDERKFQLSNEVVKFLKLRHFDVYGVSTGEESLFYGFTGSIAWILEASPNVDIFELRGSVSDYEYVDQSNEVLAKVDLKNVTTLKLSGFKVFRASFQQFASSHHHKLRNLSMTDLTNQAPEALLTILTNTAPVLKRLDLKDTRLTSDVVSAFPVCPTIQELHLDLFPGWQNFISRCFPSLQDFGAFVSDSNSFTDRDEHYQDGELPYFKYDDEVFRPNPTFVHVKSLKLHMNYELVFILGPHTRLAPVKVFTTFPALEHLHLQESLLLDYVRMKSSEFAEHLLQGLKHLEIERSRCRYETHIEPTDASFSFLAKLRGIESLTLVDLSQVIQMPVGAMPSLKLVRFSWGDADEGKLEKLLELAIQVERVVILNCCYAQRRNGIWIYNNSQSKDLLEKFFESAQNAFCGCKDKKMWQ